MASVGKYQLIEELGRGSMGTVHVARDAVLEREVALKTIRTGLGVDPEIRERFYREARTCAKLTHPSIVTIYEMGDDNGTAFIAMELLKGSDFRRHIDRKTSLPLQEKLEAIIQICDGLAHAHSEGIIHRDLKPSNLFYNPDQRRAKILDFGIARLPSSKLTVLGRILGTPNYMAPEQILNQKSDGRADLFSAAIVFFEFLVHAHPFQAPLIPRRVLDDEPDSLFDYDSSIPRPFEKVFNRAMQKRPEDRYSTADELAADMRVLLQAVRADSSPSSSLWVLLSNEKQSITVPLQKPIINEELPDGNDPEEWLLAEFLRILPEFEAAADGEDFSKARSLLQQLREIEAVDIRFADSIKVCESRLPKADPQSVKHGAAISEPDRKHQATPLETSAAASPSILLEEAHTVDGPRCRMPPSPHPVPPQRPNGAVKTCEKCRASNRASATFCADCGSKLDRVIAATRDLLSSEPLKEAGGADLDNVTTIGKPAKKAPPALPLDAPTVLDARTKSTPLLSERPMKFLIGTGLVFCALLVCIAIALLLLHRG
jgi:serine/threonine protein kinase